MSRVANRPISLPDGVNVNITGHLITIKGNKGELSHHLHPLVNVEQKNNILQTKAVSSSKFANALSGTTRALIQNIIKGVSDGFECRLEVVGVGYRAAVQGKQLNLTLGFSHPVEFLIPEGIVIETPSQTEIVIKGINKQQVGQVAANIRAYRVPEPYKGKGVRYMNERIILKEAKKA